jgi:GTP-binding protein HflX
VEQTPQIVVWNKIDAVGINGTAAALAPGVERDQYGRISRVYVSARTGAGLEELRAAIAEYGAARATERKPSKESISF